MNQKETTVQDWCDALFEARAQLAAKDAVIAGLVGALKDFEALFEQDPKMYLLPCEPNYRMTYKDSDRVDDAFDKSRAALALAAPKEE